MIKIGVRYNLIYPLFLFIFSFLREIDSIALSKIGFNGSLLLTFLMFFAEFISGLILFIYQTSFLSKRRKSSFMGIKLIQGPSEIKHPDNCFKIYFLIFMASYFDFIEFIINTLFLPNYFKDASKTLYFRQRSISTMFSAIFCIYLLKIQIFKHQKFSLFIIFLCIVSIILSEYFFEKYQNILYFTCLLLLLFLDNFFKAFIELIDKYLLEYNFINPFKILMFEGIFGLILTTSYSFKENPLKEIIDFDKSRLYILIIFLILFFLFSCGRNSYRLATNKLYSPMTRTLTDSFLDPFLIIYYFFDGNEFQAKENSLKAIYFIINLVLLIIIILCGLVYNEFLVLFCCDMEYETHLQISLRAKDIENNVELPTNDKNKEIIDNDDDDDSDSL